MPDWSHRVAMNVNSVRSMNTSLKSESLAPWAVACLWDVSSFWQTCGKDPAVQVSELETRNHRDTACSPLGCPATTYWEVTASYLKWQWYWVYQSHIRTNKVIYLKVHSLVSLECSQDKTFFLSRSTHTSVCTHNHSSFQPVKREDKC